MFLGLSSYTYTWAVGVPGYIPAKPLSAFDLVDRTFSAGLKVLQVADNLPLETWQPDQLLDLFNYANNREISLEMGSRGLTAEHTLRCLSTAELMNSSILRMVIDAPGYEPGLNQLISLINQLLPEFESRKIKLAIENHDRFKAREFEKIILSAESEWIGICLDSVNSMGAGEGFETVAEILLPYTVNLHLKDFSISRVPHKMGLVIEGRPAGSGMLNIKETISRLSAFNKCRSAILELWTPPESNLNDTITKEELWARESINNLRSLF